MRMRILIPFIALALLLGHAAAFAGDIPWSSLTPEEQRILHKARDNWERMPTERQHRLLQGAHRWREMSPRQREQATERWRERRRRD
jgi:hypothetical protein